MIRIKAPRVWRLNPLDSSIPPSHYNEQRIGAEWGRWITEAMHRRVVALVKACDTFCTENTTRHGRSLSAIIEAHRSLRAQAEKEAGK